MTDTQLLWQTLHTINSILTDLEQSGPSAMAANNAYPYLCVLYRQLDKHFRDKKTQKNVQENQS